MSKSDVFHLGLTKNDLQGATLAIVPGDPERVEKIAALMDKPVKLASHREFTSWRAELDGKPVIVCSTGIGGPPTSIAVEELAQLGIAEDQVHQLHLPEDQRPETLIGLCRDLVDALPQVTRVYACITYGSKSIPVVTLTALTCAEATHTELEVGGVYYGEVKRENGQVLSARLYDMAALYQLAGLVGTMRDSKTAEQVFHQLIWMNERRED